MILELTGQIHLEVIGPDGQLKDTRDTQNLVVDAGREHFAARMQRTIVPPHVAIMEYIAVGTSGTAAAAGNTTLVAEALPAAIGARAIMVAPYPTVGGVPPVQILYRSIFVAGTIAVAWPISLQEAGIFNEVSAIVGGEMLARGTFTAVPVDVGDTLTVDWVINVNAP